MASRTKKQQARVNRNKGKRFEKKFAEMLGTVQVGLYGGEDIWHPHFSFECKDRASFVGCNWMDQAEENNKRNVYPAVAIHKTGTSYDNTYIMLRWKDFKELFLKNIQITSN